MVIKGTGETGCHSEKSFTASGYSRKDYKRKIIRKQCIECIFLPDIHRRNAFDRKALRINKFHKTVPVDGKCALLTADEMYEFVLVKCFSVHIPV